MNGRNPLGALNPLGQLDKTRQLAQIIHHRRLIQKRQRFVAVAMAGNVEVGERVGGVVSCKLLDDDGDNVMRNVQLRRQQCRISLRHHIRDWDILTLLRSGH